MSYVNNQGVRIHYETIGQGPPLVMQYGQYFPLEVWHEYHYVDRLRDDFQLILVDARGHGDSAKIYEPEAYQTERMASDILAVLDDLGLEKAHYMGYSSGGYTGFVLAKHAQQRLLSLILGGTYPYRDPDPSNSTWHTEQIQKFEKQTTAEFVADLEGFLISQGFPPLSPRMKSAMLKHDLRALSAWHQACANGSPACDDVPGLISVPCLIYSGENTGEYAEARRAAQETRGAVFVGIPNGGHLEGGTWIDILRPHIVRLGKTV
jgi:pimeloyl-ACP methyl ester carboxylesterase